MGGLYGCFILLNMFQKCILHITDWISNLAAFLSIVLIYHILYINSLIEG